MPLVDYPLGRSEFCNGATVISATVPIDDGNIDPVTGDADPDTAFEGDIIVTITGPGIVFVDIWRGTDQTKNPWRTTRSRYPDGMPAGPPLGFPTGGPVKKLSDITWQTSAQGH